MSPAGASGGSGASGATPTIYPVYGNNPYSGGVDKTVPSTTIGVERRLLPGATGASGATGAFLVDGSISQHGLARLAATTQQDWQEALLGGFNHKLDPLSELFAKITQTFIDILEKIVGVFSEFVDLNKVIEIFNQILTFFYKLLDATGFFQLLGRGVDLFGMIVAPFGNTFEAFIQAIIGFLDWLWNGDGTPNGFHGFGDVVESALKPIVEFLASAFDLLGKNVLDAIAALFKFISDLINIGDLQSFIEKIVNFIGSFLSPQGFVDLFNNIIKWLSTIFGTGDKNVADFINSIPIIGPLVSAITGKSSADGVPLNLSTLNTYFRDLDKRLTVGVDALLEAAKKLLGGVIPVGGINLPAPDQNPNLLSQGDFLTEQTVVAGGGWSWSSEYTKTSPGGALKVVGTGSTQQIYCNQSIKVAAGDKLSLSAFVGTTNYQSGGTMTLSLVPWIGTAAQSVVTVATRSSAASNWAELAGDWTVPSNVTSVTVRLAVNVNSATTVYWDNVSLKKTGLLGQYLVQNLLDAINGILAGAGYVAGQGWQFLETAIGLVTGTANNAYGGLEDTNSTLFNNPAGGSTVIIDALPVPAIGEALGTPITAGSGAKMSRKNTTTLIDAAAGPGATVFPSNFFTDSSATSDITASKTGSSFTVTYSGWYEVEVGFTVNAVPDIAGAFNIAPAIKVGNTLEKVGGAAFGSYGFGLGGYAASAHSTFIVYLNAGEAVKAAYYNYFNAANNKFFVGDTNGVNTYFSIAMLNRTQEG